MSAAAKNSQPNHVGTVIPSHTNSVDNVGLAVAAIGIATAVSRILGATANAPPLKYITIVLLVYGNELFIPGSDIVVVILRILRLYVVN